MNNASGWKPSFDRLQVSVVDLLTDLSHGVISIKDDLLNKTVDIGHGAGVVVGVEHFLSEGRVTGTDIFATHSKEDGFTGKEVVCGEGS